MENSTIKYNHKISLALALALVIGGGGELPTS